MFKHGFSITAGVLLCIALVYAFVASFSIFLIAFGGFLISILFHALATKIEKIIAIPRLFSLLIVLIRFTALIFGLTWLVGSTLIEQYEKFEAILPNTIANLRNYLDSFALGIRFVEELDELLGNSISLLDNFQFLFAYTFGFFGDLYALTFFSIFFMVTPIDYKKGILLLVPSNYEEKANKILERVWNDLKTWLKAQLLIMLFIFTTTAIGLLIIGVDLWLILALIAGTLCFIPNIGPTIALVPAILVGLLDGIQMATAIFAVYMIVQLIETGFFGPYIRKRMLSIPPALLLFFQFALAAFTGAWGLLMATPLLVVLMILVGEIYVVESLKKSLKISGKKK